MELNPIQFKGYESSSFPKAMPLSRYTKKMYPQLTEQLNLMIKQAKLEEIQTKIEGGTLKRPLYLNGTQTTEIGARSKRKQ